LLSWRLKNNKDKPRSRRVQRSNKRSLRLKSKDKRKSLFLNKELLNSPNFRRRKLRRDLRLNVLSKSSLLLKLFRSPRLLLPRKPLLELTSPD